MLPLLLFVAILLFLVGSRAFASEGRPSPSLEAAKKRVAFTGELFACVSTLCGQPAELSDADTVFDWIVKYFPDNMAELAGEFSNAIRTTQRRIFATDEKGFLRDDEETMRWIREKKSQCYRMIKLKKTILEAYKKDVRG